MKKKTFFQRNPGICVGVIVSVLISMMAISQEKNFTLTKQKRFLAEVSFDRVVLYALIAAEQNYSFKARLLPRVHEDDYYTLILNTAKRLAMADSGRVTLPGLQKATSPDTTK